MKLAEWLRKHHGKQVLLRVEDASLRGIVHNVEKDRVTLWRPQKAMETIPFDRISAWTGSKRGADEVVQYQRCISSPTCELHRPGEVLDEPNGVHV